MARVAILENFNDTTVHGLPMTENPLPVVGWVSVAGGEINADQVTDDSFDGSGSTGDAGAPTTKKYGSSAPASSEARFLQRRLMGY